MGIRYYAYAFDPEHTEQAFADPGSFIAVDPLADAWGFPPGASIATPSFEQAVSPRDMLYLDKAWRALQSLTAPAVGRSARPSSRMFEGDVTHHECGWDRFVRALGPNELPAIAADLDTMDRDWLGRHVRVPWSRDAGEEVAYLEVFLERARAFTAALADEGRGMVYVIK